MLRFSSKIFGGREPLFSAYPHSSGGIKAGLRLHVKPAQLEANCLYGILDNESMVEGGVEAGNKPMKRCLVGSGNFGVRPAFELLGCIDGRPILHLVFQLVISMTKQGTG